jgi:hypothetical protein
MLRKLLRKLRLKSWRRSGSLQLSESQRSADAIDAISASTIPPNYVKTDDEGRPALKENTAMEAML